jgi:hypothetical protein
LTTAGEESFNERLLFLSGANWFIWRELVGSMKAHLLSSALLKN